MDVNNFFRTLDDMGKEIPAEAPWNAPHAEEWDQMTCREFVNKTCWTKLVLGKQDSQDESLTRPNTNTFYVCTGLSETGRFASFKSRHDHFETGSSYFPEMKQTINLSIVSNRS